MRKLSSLQIIKNISPIDGADKISVAEILGWKVVVPKEQFKSGDMVVYCEVDSILPFAQWSEFLRNKNNPDKPIRIRTIRLRSQISQGICFPLSILTKEHHNDDGSIVGIKLTILESDGYNWKINPPQEGDDVTEWLGITKYEPPVPACLSGVAKGRFPSFIPRTDECRIQSVPDVLKRHIDKYFYVSEKCDGCSTTFFIKDGQFGVCSRNLELKETEDNTLWKVFRHHKWDEKLTKIADVIADISSSKNFAVQGECIGEGVQGNKYKLKGQDIYLFNIFDIDNQKYLDFKDFIRVAEAIGAKTVPIVNESFCLAENVANVDTLIDLADSRSKLADVPNEGFVFRPLVEERDAELGRLSFKAINPIFLLKHNE